MPSPSIQKRQPRLKESCDHCSAAKVRCTKDKPACKRCAQKGFSCAYSHSRRAGRRNMTSSRPVNPVSSPTADRAFSITPSFSTSQTSPESFDDNSSDVFDLWCAPPASALEPSFPALTTLWDDDMYSFSGSNNNSNSHFEEISPVSHVPTMPMTSPTTFNGLTIPAFDEHFAADLIASPTMSRTSSVGTLSTQDSCSSRNSAVSSVSSHQVDAVHDELTNLTHFAEMMEKKFDTVVKTRLQYRDVYSEFGVPVDDLESPSSQTDGLGFEKGKASTTQGFVPTPDASELAFYYSLAEMKRRLKWLKEDFSTMMTTQPVC